MEVFTHFKPYDTCKNKLWVPEGNLYAIYIKEDEFAEIVGRFTSFLMNHDLKKFAKKYEDTFRKYLSWAEKLNKVNFSELSNKELAIVLKKIYGCTAGKFCDYQFLSFVVLEGLATDLEKKLSTLPHGSELLRAISTPYKETQIVKARLELLQLVAKEHTAEAYIKKYVKKYAWLPVYEFIEKPLTMADIKQQIKQINDPIQELSRYREERVKGLRAYQSYLNTVKDKKLKKLAEITHSFSYLKEMRDDYRRRAYYLLQPFWEEVSIRTELSLEETNYLLLSELLKVLKTGKNSFYSTIKARQVQYALELRGGKLYVYSGKKDAYKIASKVAVSTGSSFVAGTTASSGKAEGKVCVIFHRGEFKKFKKGCILVTTMTHPEFLPIMKLAKAIVTDEGGITCHAAIVSRELGIPCVIGTKISTQVFKDGDLVEVDANNGIIKKI